MLPAAGSIWSNATDMAKWVRFLLDSGRVDGKRLISDTGFRQLLAPQSFVSASEFYPTAQVTRPHWMTYGLGWFEQDFRGRFLAFHTGSLDGRTAMMGLLPDANVGVFIAGNLDHAEFRHALLLQVMDIFAGTNGGTARNWSTEFLALYKGIRERGEKATAELEAKRVKGSKPTLLLPNYAGTYTHPVWGDVVIALDGIGLRVSIGPNANNAGALEHWNYDTFRAFLGDGRGGASYLQFQLNGEGRVSRVIMNGDEGYTFTRVEPHK